MSPRFDDSLDGVDSLPVGHYPVQILVPATTVTIVIGLSAANVALPAGTKMVRVANNVDMFLAFGGSGVVVDTNDDMLVPSGAELFVVPDGDTHVAVISSDGSTTGKASFTEMKVV